MTIVIETDSLKSLAQEIIDDLHAAIEKHVLAGRDVTVIITSVTGDELEACYATTIEDHEEFFETMKTAIDELTEPYLEEDDENEDEPQTEKRNLQ